MEIDKALIRERVAIAKRNVPEHLWTRCDACTMQQMLDYIDHLESRLPAPAEAKPSTTKEKPAPPLKKEVGPTPPKKA